MYEDRDSALYAPRRYNREPDGNILTAGNGAQRAPRKEPMNSYQYPQHSQREPYANPLLKSIEDSEDLLLSLDEAAQRLERAIADAAIAKAAERDAKEALAQLEAEQVVEWTAQADAGEGPLKGVAKTSKAYGYALDTALAKLRRDGLYEHAARADRATVNAMNASINLERAQVAFKALMAAADLRTAILNGRAKSY